MENKLTFVGFFILGFFESLFGVLVPYFSKLQIDHLENNYENIFNIFYLDPIAIFVLIIFVGVFFELLMDVFSFLSISLSNRINHKTSIRVEQELLEHVNRFDISFMKNPRNRRIVDGLMNSIYLIDDFLNFFYRQIELIISVLAIFPIIAYFNPGILLVIIFFGFVQVLLINYKIKRSVVNLMLREKYTSRLWQLQNLLFYQTHNIANIDSKGFVLKKYWQVKEKNHKIDEKDRSFDYAFHIFDFIIRNLSYFLIASYAGIQVIEGIITIGSFVMILMYISILQNFFSKITEIISEFNNIRIKIYKLDFFMGLKSRLNLDNIKKIKDISGDVIFEGVYFSYPGFYDEEIKYIKSLIKNEKNLKKKEGLMFNFEDLKEWKEIICQRNKKMPVVLKNINIKFKKGEITSLIGRNGSGKTTIAHLINRNYDSIKGKVSIGGKDLINLDPNFIRTKVGIIPQEPFLLEGFSIRENISFGLGKSFKNDKKIWDMLRILDIEKEIKVLPKKLDSIIGEDVCLSGGQSQLISIARLLIQDRTILIFDEGTNQLDAEHESKIMDALRKIKKDRTIIMITHRMTTARKADKVCVLDDGKIVETGSHSELHDKKNGLYRKMWNLQILG